MLMAPDPRIEAASDALGLAGHRPPDDALRAAFAAADAVDPLRAEDFLALVALAEKIVDKHYPAGTFTGESGDRGARFVAAVRRALADLGPQPVPGLRHRGRGRARRR